MKQDNSTEKQKVALRRQALKLLDEQPVVLEAYGGYGTLYRKCYQSATSGCVFEQDRKKARALAQQRPTWAVYQGDCIPALQQGAGSHLAVNVLDLDPYGSPWPALAAFLTSERPHKNTLVIVINDGLRLKVQRQGAWEVESIAPMVRQFGNDLYGCYLEACQWFLKQQATQANYHLSRWTGYYCGHNQQMTHYLAELVQEVRHAA